VLEVVPHDLGLSLTTAKVAGYVFPHRYDIRRPAAAHGVAFNVLVQKLVRVQVWPVARKIEQPYPTSFRFQPLLHRSRPVDGMTIHDKIDPAPHLPLQPSHEIDEHPGPKPLIQNHEIELAPVGDRRYHAAAEPLSRTPNHRRSPFQSPTRPRGMVRPKPALVSPVNLRLIPLGLGPDQRIVLLQPAPDRFRVRFEGPPDRLLRRKSPFLQVPPHRPNRKTRPVALFDQASHRLSRPQEKSQLQLIGRLVGDRSRDHLGLPGREGLSFGPTLRLGGQNLEAFGPGLFDPGPDGLPRDTEYPGRLHLALPIPNGLNGPPTELFLGGRRQRSGIFVLHEDSLSYQIPKSKLFIALINKYYSTDLQGVPSPTLVSYHKGHAEW